MVRKYDPVTDENFECTGDTGRCWCFDLPPLDVTDAVADCKGPEHLRRLIEESQKRRIPPRD